MGIKALSARQRRDDRCRAKLKEHIEGVNQLLAPSKPAAEQVGLQLQFTIFCDTRLLFAV